MRVALASASFSRAVLSPPPAAKAPVKGFSMTTCLPASMACSAAGSWLAGGEHTSTTSTCGSIASRLG